MRTRGLRAAPGPGDPTLPSPGPRAYSSVMTRVWSIVGEGKVDREFLAKIPIFAGLPPEILDRFIASGQVMDVPASCQLLAEGDPARSVFVVCEGVLEIRKRGASGGDTRVAVLRAGDCVGEMSLIDIQPRSAGVSSVGPAAMAVLSHSDLATLYREDPAAYTILVLNIAREISRRLRRVDVLLADILIDLNDVWLEANRSLQPTRKED